MHQDPQEVLQVSRSARVNCAVHVSRDFLFHALMGFFGFVDSDLISNSSYCLPYSSGDVGLENLVWNKLVAGSLCLQCSWEMLFFESEDTEVFKADRNKLVARNEKQTDKFIP